MTNFIRQFAGWMILLVCVPLACYAIYLLDPGLIQAYNSNEIKYSDHPVLIPIALFGSAAPYLLVPFAIGLLLIILIVTILTVFFCDEDETEQ